MVMHYQILQWDVSLFLLQVKCLVIFHPRSAMTQLKIFSLLQGPGHLENKVDAAKSALRCRNTLLL